MKFSLIRNIRSDWIRFMLLCMLVISNPVGAQIQSARYESIRDNRFSDHLVIPVDEAGVLVVEQTAIKGGVDNNWEMNFLNERLSESWQTTFIVESTHQLRSYHQDEEHLYFLFQEKNMLMGDFTILTVSINSGNKNSFLIQNELEFDYAMSMVIQGKVVIGGYVNLSPTVLMVNPQSQSSLVLPGYFSKKGQILSLNMNQDKETFNVLTQESGELGNRLLLKTFGQSGQILFEKAIQLRKNIDLYDGISYGFVEGNIAIAGAYGSFREMFTQGVMIGLIAPEDGQTKLEYHSLAQFDRIFDFETEENASRLRNRTDQKELKGKELKSNLLIDLQQFVYQNGGFIASADLYHKTTDQVRINQNHAYGDNKKERMDDYPFRQAVFPFQYDFFDAPKHRDRGINIHTSSFRGDVLERMGSFVLGFDKQGMVQWDNLLPLLPADRVWMNQLSDAYIDQENVHLLYRHEDQVIFTSVPYTSLSTNEMATTLRGIEGDKDIRKFYPGIGGVLPWYNTGFIIWGYQRIRSENGKRNVLYINKVDF